MANVGKRTRSGGAKLEPKWCDSLTPHQQLQQYGRSICFRVADTGTGVFEFYCIPFDFNDDSDSQSKNQKNDEPPPLPTVMTHREQGKGVRSANSGERAAVTDFILYSFQFFNEGAGHEPITRRRLYLACDIMTLVG
ncbi:hypothetical protein RHGRI_016535 [Rhododendron griersonianum]|nr:hypothetical protein RHGRI_016535 [Rhododendron griersonianum]